MSNEEEHSRSEDKKADIFEYIVEKFPLIVIPVTLIQELISMIRGEPEVTTLDLSKQNRAKGDEEK